MNFRMTALPQDVVAELKTRIAELEQQLQAGNAENARLEHAVALSRDRQQASAEILRTIARTPVDAMQSLQQIAETCGRLFGAPSVSIRLAENGEWTGGVGYGETSKRVRSAVPTATIRIGGPNLPGTVVAENRQIHIPDLDHIDPAMADWPGLPYARAAGTRTVCGTPLRREDQAIGVLIVYRDKLLPFTPEELILQQSFADQAVIAIENARLFDEVQARTRDLAASIEDLRAAQDRLIQTEKLASLGQLTAGIAHEIKNPLNFVNNFAALSAELTDELNDALASSALPDKTRAEVDELTGLLKDNLQKVVQHGRRADSIVKNMLLHSREGSGEHRPTDLNALVEESLNLAYHGARAEKPHFNVTIRRELDPRAGTAELFPQEITRVLLNLIANGFYAVAKRKAEDGGADYQPVMVVTTRDRGDHVEIRIRDNGTGIPLDVKEKMFNPFFTTKPAGEGTGLGLSMSHDIVVKQHAGTIDVETLSGEFTEFTIRLPRRSSFPDEAGISEKTRGEP
jgi:signal transduction histidine kinase